MAARGMLKFYQGVQIEAVCVPSLKQPSHVIAISEAKNWKKVDNFEPVFLATMDIDEKSLWFLNTLLITFFMVMFIYSASDKIFPFFNIFFFYHYLLLNHKTLLDHIVNYYRYPEVLVPA